MQRLLTLPANVELIFLCKWKSWPLPLSFSALSVCALSGKPEDIINDLFGRRAGSLRRLESFDIFRLPWLPFTPSGKKKYIMSASHAIAHTEGTKSFSSFKVDVTPRESNDRIRGKFLVPGFIGSGWILFHSIEEDQRNISGIFKKLIWWNSAAKWTVEVRQNAGARIKRSDSREVSNAVIHRIRLNCSLFDKGGSEEHFG